MAYDALFRSVFARMDPETIHHRAFAAIRAGRFATRSAFRVEADPVTVMGVEFPHRFGLAAGFDKNAIGVPALLALGFGHVEIGTVTAQPQPGNDRPRLFRLVDDHAIINRMGFNNDGAAAVASRLHRLRKTRAGRRAIIGVNIGKTKVVPAERAVEDYAESARLLSPYADYLVVNVSSPNTPGLRDLQSVDALKPILEQVKSIADRSHLGRVPLVVKIAPDLADEDIDAVTDLALSIGLDGISATNTTIARPDSLATDRTVIEAIGAGGLSGPILAPRALDVVRRIRQRAGTDLAIIGVGGITTEADVHARIEAGADLVQGYTGFIYGGPAWPSRMARASVTS